MNLQVNPEIVNRLRAIVLSGPRLDALAAHHGLKRKRLFWIFKEADSTLLARVLAHVKGKQ